jgi:hypothetical protein
MNREAAKIDFEPGPVAAGRSITSTGLAPGTADYVESTRSDLFVSSLPLWL